MEQRGRLVTKEELLDNVWGDRFVSESALTTRIKQARRAVDDDGATQWAIKTVHGRGYRFLPEVAVDDAPTAADGSDDAAPQAPPSALPDELQADARQLFCGRTDELEHAARILERSGADPRLRVDLDPRRTRDRQDPPGRRDCADSPAIEGIESCSDATARTSASRTSRSSRCFASHPALRLAACVLPADLAPLLPESADLDATGPHADSALDNETRRYRMFEAMADWLVDHSAAAPVTMIVDDVHWASDSTLQLLGAPPTATGRWCGDLGVDLS